MKRRNSGSTKIVVATTLTVVALVGVSIFSVKSFAANSKGQEPRQSIIYENGDEEHAVNLASLDAQDLSEEDSVSEVSVAIAENISVQYVNEKTELAAELDVVDSKIVDKNIEQAQEELIVVDSTVQKQEDTTTHTEEIVANEETTAYEEVTTTYEEETTTYEEETTAYEEETTTYEEETTTYEEETTAYEEETTAYEEETTTYEEETTTYEEETTAYEEETTAYEEETTTYEEETTTYEEETTTYEEETTTYEEETTTYEEETTTYEEETTTYEEETTTYEEETTTYEEETTTYEEETTTYEEETTTYEEETTTYEEETTIYDDDISYDAGLASQIVNYAYQWVGVTPYIDAADRWSEEDGCYINSLTEGTDCSGFTHLIYGEFGIYVPTWSDAYQYGYVGTMISYDQLMPGDIVVYDYGGHVAIYAGGDTIIHCSNPADGTKVSTMWYKNPTAYVRVVY